MEAPGLAPPVAPLNKLVVSVALATCLLLVFVAALFLVRRLAGSFQVELDSAALLVCAGVLLALSAMPRLAGWRMSPMGRNGRLRLALLALPAIAIVMLAVSLTFATAPLWPLALVWLGIAVEEGSWWSLYYRASRSRAVDRPVPREGGTAIAAPARLEVAARHENVTSDAELISSNVIQQTTRVREQDAEWVYGILRGDFAPGERTQNLHLAFCPPLARVPEFSFEQVEGPPAAVKAAQVESFGVRLEVRLSAALDEPSSVLVEFSARAASGGRPS